MALSNAGRRSEEEGEDELLEADEGTLKPSKNILTKAEQTSFIFDDRESI